MLVEAAEKELAHRYVEFLQWLHPVCIREESEEKEDEEASVGRSGVDNAVAAVAKMIVVAPEALPLSQLLPILLAALPMREDFSESTVVFQAFLHLIGKNDVTIIGMAKEVVGLLVDSFKPESEVPEAARDLAGRAIASLALNPACRDSVYSCLSSVTDAAHIDKLQRRLSVHGMIWKGE